MLILSDRLLSINLYDLHDELNTYVKRHGMDFWNQLQNAEARMYRSIIINLINEGTIDELSDFVTLLQSDPQPTRLTLQVLNSLEGLTHKDRHATYS